MWPFLSWFKPASVFTTLERDILNAVLDAMAPPLKDHFRTQLNAINRIQRLTHGKEVNLYRLRRGRPDFPEQLLFPVHDELELARVDFTVDGGERRSSASVRVVSGRLFSIVFATPPRRSAKRAKVHVERVRLRTVSGPALSNSSDALQSEARRIQAEGVVDARLPDDYLPLLAAPEKHEGFTVYDPSRVRLVALDACNFYIVAERDDRIGLGVVQGSNDGQVYRVDYEDGELIPAGLNLAEALRSQRALH
jgi:hypothetical protein